MTGQEIIDQVFTRLGPVADRAESGYHEADRIAVRQVEATLALAQAVVDLHTLISVQVMDQAGRLRTAPDL